MFRVASGVVAAIKEAALNECQSATGNPKVVAGCSTFLSESDAACDVDSCAAECANTFGGGHTAGRILHAPHLLPAPSIQLSTMGTVPPPHCSV